MTKAIFGYLMQTLFSEFQGVSKKESEPKERTAPPINGTERGTVEWAWEPARASVVSLSNPGHKQ
jgi:hypothetical protein